MYVRTLRCMNRIQNSYQKMTAIAYTYVYNDQLDWITILLLCHYFGIQQRHATYAILIEPSDIFNFYQMECRKLN